MTTRRKRELELLRFFMHDFYKDTEVTDEDVAAYFVYSERGEKFIKTPGITALLDAKKWRDWHLKSYRQDIRMGMLFLHELDEIVQSALTVSLEDEMRGALVHIK